MAAPVVVGVTCWCPSSHHADGVSAICLPPVSTCRSEPGGGGAALDGIHRPVQPELPTGTVTFLFTDIEGSTQLLKQLGVALR